MYQTGSYNHQTSQSPLQQVMPFIILVTYTPHTILIATTCLWLSCFYYCFRFCAIIKIIFLPRINAVRFCVEWNLTLCSVFVFLVNCFFHSVTQFSILRQEVSDYVSHNINIVFISCALNSVLRPYILFPLKSTEKLDTDFGIICRTLGTTRIYDTYCLFFWPKDLK